MERVPARMGIVTLGVSDLKRSIAGTISWFRTADGYLGLFPYEELAADARVDAPTRGSFGGVTLAINVETVEGVGVALDAAVGAGGTLLKPATELPFGVSGYFADPDGYVWEVAHNPSFPIADDGRLTIA